MGWPSQDILSSLLSEGGGSSCGRLWCCSSRVFVCVTCFSLTSMLLCTNQPSLLCPPRLYCPHCCNTIARLLRNIRPPRPPLLVCHTPYHISNKKIVYRPTHRPTERGPCVRGMVSDFPGSTYVHLSACGGKAVEFVEVFCVRGGSGGADINCFSSISMRIVGWPLQEIRLARGLCTRINTIIRKHPLGFGTQLPTFIAYTVAQNSTFPRPSCIARHAIQYW